MEHSLTAQYNVQYFNKTDSPVAKIIVIFGNVNSIINVNSFILFLLQSHFLTIDFKTRGPNKSKVRVADGLSQS